MSAVSDRKASESVSSQAGKRNLPTCSGVRRRRAQGVDWLVSDITAMGGVGEHVDNLTIRQKPQPPTPDDFSVFLNNEIAIGTAAEGVNSRNTDLLGRVGFGRFLGCS